MNPVLLLLVQGTTKLKPLTSVSYQTTGVDNTVNSVGVICSCVIPERPHAILFPQHVRMLRFTVGSLPKSEGARRSPQR